MRKRIPLGPLDAEGVRHDRPSNQVRWMELTNVVFQEGRLRNRPGLYNYKGIGGIDLPSTQPAPIVSIHEIWNPGSSATGRESYTPGADTLTPNGSSDVVAGWSPTGAATNHEAVDEGTPDNSTSIMSTSTLGAAVALDFTNVTLASYTAIFGVVFHIRARITANGDFAKLNFYYRTGSTNYAIGSAFITVREEAESEDWQDVFIVMDRDPATDSPIDGSFINGMKLVIELDSSESRTAEILEPDGNGATTDWEDLTDATTADFSDCDGKIGSVNMNQVPTGLPSSNWMVPTATEDVQLFTFTSSKTWSTIDYVRVGGYANKSGPGGYWQAQVVYSDGDTGAEADEYVLATVESPPGQWGRSIAADSDANPDDDAAWEKADINNGSFGVKWLRGTTPPQLGTFSMTIGGTVSGGTAVQVTTVNAQVVGADSDTTFKGLIDKRRLWSTNLAHYQLEDDTIAPTVTDVTNSVPLDSTGPGWPVNNAVLYGQAYLVNGVDPTVRYPNGSDLYEELSTNNADGATALTGRVVASFADRIFYGWVKDDSTVTPERVAFSKIRDGGTHNHFTAGDFDLLDTPGGVVALVPIDESHMAALKEQGIYTIRRTGNATIPFIRDVVDFKTKCLAGQTAVRAQRPDGSPVVLFLGQNSTSGINVFAFDGTNVTPVGNQIARKLRDDMNHQAAPVTAHAGIDPHTHTYWLFIPEDEDMFPEQAWVMTLKTGEWTRAEFPYEVFCSGSWHLPPLDFGTGSSEFTLGGEEYLMVGGSNTVGPLAVVPFRASDELGQATSDNTLTSDPEDREDFTAQGRGKQVYTATMVTGDLVKPAGMEVVAYTLGILWTAKTVALRVVIDASEDGGLTWNTSVTHFLDPPNDGSGGFPTLGGVHFSEIDLTPSHAASVRYRIRVQPEPVYIDGDATEYTFNSIAREQPFEFYDMWLSMEDGASNE